MGMNFLLKTWNILENMKDMNEKNTNRAFLIELKVLSCVVEEKKLSSEKYDVGIINIKTSKCHRRTYAVNAYNKIESCSG